MSKKACLVWCLCLGLLDGVYCVVCRLIPHVQNFMWIGFISLPIYFCGGAKLRDMPKAICCAAAGALWGALTLVVMGLGLIANSSLNMFVWVTVIVALCCFVHLGLTTENVLGGIFSNCPMVFGGFAAIFSQGTGELLWVILTLVLGIVLGYVMGAISAPITRWIDKGVAK